MSTSTVSRLHFFRQRQSQALVIPEHADVHVRAPGVESLFLISRSACFKNADKNVRAPIDSCAYRQPGFVEQTGIILAAGK
jgi:hypothetical protein